jgi:intracellular sulfur oxidation DsrE/DsrF family protein
MPRLVAIKFLIVATMLACPAFAQERAPAITGYGTTVPVEEAEERPDPSIDYRTVFDIREGGNPEAVNPSLEGVARFLNLLAQDDIHPEPGAVVAVVHGSATPIVSNDALYAKKTGVAANPNIELIAELRAAGVTISVCGQALNKHGIPPEALLDGVRLDVAALTTLTTLQLRGYALIPG